MEFLLVIVVILIATVVMPWVNMGRISKLERRISILERHEAYKNLDIPEKRQRVEEPPQIKIKGIDETSKNPWHNNALDKPAEITFQSDNEIINDEEVEEAYKIDTDKQSGRKWDFEFDLMSKLPVWIGSVSVIFAIFFLVKYSIEYGLLGPLTRLSLGAVGGLIMIGLGLWIHKKQKMANAERISQGLAGAGIAALYVCAYASVNLYGLLDVATGFSLMAVITFATILMAAKMGQPIALLGLFGGLLTPAMMNTGEANAVGLFGFLFLLYGSIIGISAVRQWWKLSLVALAGVYCWAYVWLAVSYNEADSLLYILFTMGIMILTLTVNEVSLKKTDNTAALHIVNIAAMSAGMASVILICVHVTLGLFDWAMLTLISLAFIGLAVRHNQQYLNALTVNIFIMHIMYAFWVHGAAPTDVAILTVVFIALYIVVPQLITMRSANKIFWPLLQIASGIALFCLTYIELSEYRDMDSAIWAIIALIGAGLTGYKMLIVSVAKDMADHIRAILSAVYLWVTNGFVLTSVSMALPSEYWAVTLAAYVTGLAYIYNKTGEERLKDIIAALLGLFIMLNYKQVFLFLEVIISSFVGENLTNLEAFVLENPSFHLGLSAVMTYITFVFLTGRNKEPQGLSHAVFGVANILLMMTGYYLFREMFHDGEGHIFMSEIGFVERGIITIMLAACGLGIIEYTRRHDFGFLKPWGVGLFRMAVIRFVWFDLCMHNPYFETDQIVGSVPVLNGITLTYGGMLAALIAMLRHRDYLPLSVIMQKIYGGLAMVALYVLTSLYVRHAYHGTDLADGIIGIAELYTYSVVWLLTGLALLAVGLVKNNVDLRKCSLVFITLVVGKVFLIDASELEGLYRVMSFMGLGVSLIGLSYFYTKFISNKKAAQHA